MASTDSEEVAVAESAWTAAELRACVEAYRGLLLAEERGERLNKSALRRSVLSGPLKGRSAGSYEFRMQNISAVLSDLGATYVRGYLPRRNVGRLKPTLVALINELWDRAALSETPTSDPAELETRVEAARELLREGHRAPPPGYTQVARVQGAATRFVRDPNVIAWVLESAAGACEVCSSPAPFVRGDGEPYLEVHHVRTLAEGGPDTTDNAVASCPNCHRRLHYGADRERLRRAIIAKINRIIDHPRRHLPTTAGSARE